MARRGPPHEGSPHNQHASANHSDAMNNARIIELLNEEQATFAERHPRSRALFERGQQHYLYGAPSHWMRRWAGGFPFTSSRRPGQRFTVSMDMTMSIFAWATPVGCVVTACQRSPRRSLGGSRQGRRLCFRRRTPIGLAPSSYTGSVFRTGVSQRRRRMRIERSSASRGW